MRMWQGVRIGTNCLNATLLAGLSVGCQTGKPIQSQRLIEHQALVDFSGLKPAEHIPELNVHGALPAHWTRSPFQKTALYSQTYWRSPSGHTGVGAVDIHLPLPISADMVLWLAEREYTKKANDGRLIAKWKDELGRSWFEAESKSYHVRGYALAQGFEAWVVFFGYRLDRPPEPGEIGIAARSADTFIPLVNRSPSSPTTRPFTQPAL